MDSLLYLDSVYSNMINFSLIFTRIMTLFYTISIFRREMATVRVIITLSMLLALYALLLSKPKAINIDVISLQFFLQEIMQMLIGFSSGLLINIVFEVFSSAGQIISMQIGLSTASLFDPKFGMITSLTHFYIVVAMVIFFGLSGHLMIIDVIVNSFMILPTDTLISKFHGDVIVHYAGIIFLGGTMISMTIIAAIMMTNICLAILSKFAPQFNLFSVGLNMSLLVGLICIYLSFNVTTNLGTGYIKQSLLQFKSYFNILVQP